MLEIIIPGAPVPKMRPRLGLNCVYDKQHYKKVGLQSYIASKYGKPLFDGPLSVTIYYLMPIPDSWPAYKKRRPPIHVDKPDCDNLTKWILDAGNGILWKDDSQIFAISEMKRYDNDPKTVMIIEKC